MSIGRFTVPTSLLLCVLGNFHKKKGTFYKKDPFSGWRWKTGCGKHHISWNEEDQDGGLSFLAANTPLLWKSLNTCFSLRDRSCLGEVTFLFIFPMSTMLNKGFLALLHVFFFLILGAKTIYDYNVIMMHWPLPKCPVFLSSNNSCPQVYSAAVNMAIPTFSRWVFPWYVYIFFLSFYFQTVCVCS